MAVVGGGERPLERLQLVGSLQSCHCSSSSSRGGLRGAWGRAGMSGGLRQRAGARGRPPAPRLEARQGSWESWDQAREKLSKGEML